MARFGSIVCLLLVSAVHGFVSVPTTSDVIRCRSVTSLAVMANAHKKNNDNSNDDTVMTKNPSRRQLLTSAFAATALTAWTAAWPLTAAAASVEGAAGSNAKLLTGGASTLQSGRTISITRGVNLDNADFANQNLKGVAFQQSIVRDADFRNSNLMGASFFDATLDGSNFENA